MGMINMIKIIMNKFGLKLFLLLFFVSGTLFANSNYMTGKFYERLNAPPWVHTMLYPDTAKIDFEYKPVNTGDSIKILVIKDYQRFAPEGKGENYKEIEGVVNEDGTFSVDLSEFKDGELVVVIALRKGYIKLWHVFRYCKTCDYKNVKIFFVKIR